ncbi:MAG: hypothetical protein IT435_16130 [Phycisphaerales bacterium]|nr:hypothetical protein [Phycisphaerales bacterium]
MPAEVTQEQIDAVTTEFADAGVPASLSPSIFQAIDAAGYTLVEKDSGDPASVMDEATLEIVRLAGKPNCWLVGVRMPGRGWYVWRERTMPDGSTEVSAPSYVDGDRESLLDTAAP